VKTDNFEDNFKSMFGDMFSSEDQEPVRSKYVHKECDFKLQEVFTFCRSRTACKIRPTKSGKYAIVDPQDTVIEIFIEVKEAKREFIRLVIGS